MTDNEIIKSLECCTDRKSGFTCNGCPLKNVPFCGGEIMRGSLDLINRLKAENEELNEIYTNISNATVQHSVDNEKDRQLLSEFQNIFLGLGHGIEEVSDPELKEIKAWKDRMIWHCKKADELLSKNKKLKAENERLKDILYDAEGVNLVNYWHQQCKIAENGCRNFEEENKKLKAENKRLESLCEKIGIANDAKFERICVLQEDLETAKCEAYKEFAERLKEIYRTHEGLEYEIDNLLKEMESKQ